jgi:hypothetical protein
MTKPLSQKVQIRNWLESGNPITPLEALDRFGTMRLGAHIHELRSCGMNIKTSYPDKGKRYAIYTLLDSLPAAQLQLGIGQ